MRDSDSVRRLEAELRQDYDFIKLNADKNRIMSERIANDSTADEFSYAALGYTLHNLYNAFEGYFLRVAKFFENYIDELTWHRALLERMGLTIEGVRPALLDRDISLRIEELLKFRHVFRNIYKTPLIPAKVSFANEAALGITEAFEPCHERFMSFLSLLIRELDASEDAKEEACNEALTRRRQGTKEE